MFKNLEFDPFDVILTDTEFKINFRPLTRQPLSWLEELSIAANKYKAVTRPIYVGMSGGIDSEVIAKIFLKEKVEFTPLIVEYTHNGVVINEHDIRYAKDFCRENNLTPVIHTVTAQHLMMMMFDQQYFKYSRVGSLYQYIQIFLVRLVNDLSGFLVTGSGVQNWTYDEQLKFKINSVYFNVYNYMNDHNMNHWPSFYWTTPELIRSYVDIPVVKNYFKNPILFKYRNQTEKLKKEVYQQVFPELLDRKKYHGYEKFYQIKLYQHLTQEIINYEYSVTKMTYHDFIEQFDRNLAKTIDNSVGQ